MFDNFTIIPYTAAEGDSMLSPISDINYEFIKCELINKTNTSVPYTYLEAMLQLLNNLKSIKDPETYQVLRYDKDNCYRFNRRIEDYGDGYHGMVINQEPGSHFNPNSYPTAKFMTAAQEVLKQSPRHFLRIFTVEKSSILYIWTNKELTFETIYKLLTLLEKTYPQNNELYNTFLEKCIKRNADEARKVLTDFFNSDEILNVRFKQFTQCLTATVNGKVNRLINEIESARRTINDYETAITTLAATIREKTENITFLKSNDNEEDIKLLFKYLNKSPYIAKYNAQSSGSLIFYYEAPLLYYNEYPAEKMLDQEWRELKEKQITKIILGKKYTLWTKCKIQFDLSDFRVELLQRNDNTPLLPHPHIDRYGCFGNHMQAIREAAESGNHIGAIEQITQAVLNLNFYDGCVIDTMFTTIKREWNNLPTWRCEETGEMLTTEKIIERGDYYEEA